MTSRRQERVSELLHQELGILITELTDSRLEDALPIVTRVDVSQDLRNARVYIEHQLPSSSSRQILEALYHAESFLRRGLVERLDLRYVPHLSFHIDDTSTRAQRVDELLDQVGGAAERHDDDSSQPD